MTNNYKAALTIIFLIQYLVDETARRRKLQLEYNKQNNIIPKTIKKSIEEIKLSTVVADESMEEPIDKIIIDDKTLDGMEAKEMLESLNRKMLKYARDLQFENAALLRDKIREIEESVSYK